MTTLNRTPQRELNEKCYRERAVDLVESHMPRSCADLEKWRTPPLIRREGGPGNRDTLAQTPQHLIPSTFHPQCPHFRNTPVELPSGQRSTKRTSHLDDAVRVASYDQGGDRRDGCGIVSEVKRSKQYGVGTKGKQGIVNGHFTSHHYYARSAGALRNIASSIIQASRGWLLRSGVSS